MSLNVYFETYGCQMNVSDTERARDAVERAGMSVVENSGDADVVMINTCSIRAKAERKVLGRVNELHHMLRSKPQLIGIMGCVAQLEGDNLFDAKGKISLVVGTQAIKRLPQIIESAYTSQTKILDLAPGRVHDQEQISITSRTSKVVAFVPIIEGCNKFCAYCIVPYSRGRERSRPAQEILEEIGTLQEQGIKEVHLIGQNVNSYRPPASDNILQNYKGATPFVKLLKAVGNTGMNRVKFTTSYPRDFHYEIIETLNDYNNLCNWIHLPVQSGSNRVLQAMRRGYTRDEYLQKIAKIHSSTKKVAVTTDIIIGFPNETELEFEETLSLVEEVQFDSSYIFNYSPRTGTPAFQLSDSVSQEVKAVRFARLKSLQDKIQKIKFERLIGETLSVLVEGISVRDNSTFTGHSTCHKVINFTGNNLALGNIVNVQITSVKTNSLYGIAQ